MLLAIDVGNTNMVFGIFEGDTMRGSFRLKTDLKQTPDEIGLLIWSYFQRFALDVSQVEDVVIATVVPGVMRALTSAIVRYFGRAPLVIDDGLDSGLPYGVSGNERLGADRAVGCVAAISRYGAPLILLDFGTATTLDAVSREGKYMGGCILAGLHTTVEALTSGAALLPHVELSKPSKVLDSTAVGQIRSGTVLSYIGGIEHLICQAKAEMGETGIKVVATGGLGQMVAEGSDLIDAFDRKLTLDGLKIIYNREKFK